jgi:hypothetical protein
VPFCAGFHPPIFAHRLQRETAWERPKIVLRLANENDNENDREMKAAIPEESSKMKFEVPKLVRDIGMGVSLFWDYSITFLGVALSCGLVLNLLGFGYIVSKEDGLRIDTLKQLRIERQFQRVSTKYASEYQPPSSLPR